jgi:hypothetical protein
VGVHLADTQRQRVEVLLQRAARAVDDGLLLRELVTPRGNLGLRVADTENARCRDATIEGRGTNQQGRRDDAEPNATGGQPDVGQMPPIL